MRKATSALFFLLLIVFSCTKESVNPDLESGEDFLKGAKVKIKTLKIHESSGTMEVVNNGDCPFGIQFLIQGTGHATHMGAFTVQNTFCIDFDGNPVSPIKGILTAANGDQIFTQVEYVLDGVYHYLILDGNGRFEGAKGFIDMWGLIDYPNMIFELEGLGEIQY